MKQQVSIVGENVTIKSIDARIDREIYIDVRKNASIYTDMYYEDESIWINGIMPGINEEIESDEYIDCLIYENVSNQVCGYIVLEHFYKDPRNIGIGIIKEYRNKGYGKEAAKIFITEILNKYTDIKMIEWKASDNNEASNKIAVNIGGQVIRTESIWGESELSRAEEIYETYGAKMPMVNVYSIE